MQEMFSVGDVVADRYQVESQVESGPGFSVWVVRDKKRPEGALRLHAIHAATTEPPATSDLLRHEIELSRAIRIPYGVVVARDVGVTDGIAWRVYEAREGFSLRSLVARRGTLPIAFAIDVAVGAATVLAELHQAGVAHLGIDSDSIHVGPGDQGVWIDAGRFWAPTKGEARSPFRDSRSTAPERRGNRSRPDARTDVYDLASLLIAIVSGTATRTTQGAAEGADDMPATVKASSIPERLRKVIERCLSNDPANRPADALELRDELTLVRDEFSIAATSTMQARSRNADERPSEASVIEKRLGESREDETVTSPHLAKGAKAPGKQSLTHTDFGDNQPFEIEKVLGRGGMGVVYLARDKKLDRRVAIKLHELAPEEFQEGQESLVREARFMARLPVHPNVVAVFAADELVDGRLYVVMEYIEGGSLRAELRANPEMTRDRFQRIAVDVCKGVAHAHAHGLVHKDIKPENVMVAADGRHKIADFGIAGALQKTGMMSDSRATVSGTPAYMSPEQFENQKLTPASDVYAIGCMLYELINGAPPFTGRDVWRQHFFDQPKPPRFRFNAASNQEVEQIVLKCLSKDPKERYKDAAELGEAISRALRKDLDGASTTGLDQTFETRSTGSMAPRRNPALRWINAASLILAVCVAGVLVYKSIGGGNTARKDARLEVSVAGAPVEGGARVVLKSLADLEVTVRDGDLLSATWVEDGNETALAILSEGDRPLIQNPPQSTTGGSLILRFGTESRFRAEKFEIAAEEPPVDEAGAAAAAALLATKTDDLDPAALDDLSSRAQTLLTSLSAPLEGRLSRGLEASSGLTDAMSRWSGLAADRRRGPALRVLASGRTVEDGGQIEVKSLGDVELFLEVPNGPGELTAQMQQVEILRRPVAAGEPVHLTLENPQQPVAGGSLRIEAKDRFGNRCRLNVSVTGRRFEPDEALSAKLDRLTGMIERREIAAVDGELAELRTEYRRQVSAHLNRRPEDEEKLAGLERRLAEAHRRENSLNTPPVVQVTFGDQTIADGATLETASLSDIALEISAPNGLESWEALLGEEKVGSGTRDGRQNLGNPSQSTTGGMLIVRSRDLIGLKTEIRVRVTAIRYALGEAATEELKAIEALLGGGKVDEAADRLDTLDRQVRGDLAARLDRDPRGLQPIEDLRRRIEADRARLSRAPSITCATADGVVEPNAPVTVVSLADLSIRVDASTASPTIRATFQDEPVEVTLEGGFLRLGNPKEAASRGILAIEVLDGAGRSTKATWPVVAKAFELGPIATQELQTVVADLNARRNLDVVVSTLERIRNQADQRRRVHLNRRPDDLAAIDSRLEEARRAQQERRTPVTPIVPTPQKPTLAADGDSWAKIRWRRVNAGGRDLFVAENELSWAEFRDWWLANRSRLPDAVEPDAGDMPVGGIRAETFEEFARSIGARLPTDAEWRAFADVSGGTSSYREAYPRVSNPNCNSFTFTSQRAREIANYSLSPKPVRDSSYAGHGLGGRFFHIAGNVREIVKSNAGYLAMGSSYDSKTAIFSEGAYKGPRKDTGVRLVIDP